MAIFERLLLYFDPVAFFLVIGGAVLLAVLRTSCEDAKRAFAALGPLFRANPQEDAIDAIRTVRAVEHIAGAKSIAATDRVRSRLPFLHSAALKLSDARTAHDFIRWAEENLEDRRRRHRGAIHVWNAIADAAPAMGMVGTIIGLVGMFAAMQDADRIGPAMALAMLTTLYGLLLGNVIAAPIAKRLEHLSDDEIAWQRRALDHLESLAHRELDHAIPLRIVS